MPSLEGSARTGSIDRRKVSHRGRNPSVTGRLHAHYAPVIGPLHARYGPRDPSVTCPDCRMPVTCPLHARYMPVTRLLQASGTRPSAKRALLQSLLTPSSRFLPQRAQRCAGAASPESKTRKRAPYRRANGAAARCHDGHTMVTRRLPNGCMTVTRRFQVGAAARSHDCQTTVTRRLPNGCRWVQLLAAELETRAAQDRARWSRRAKTLKVQYRGQLRPDHKEMWVAGNTRELTATSSRQVCVTMGGAVSDGDVVDTWLICG